MLPLVELEKLVDNPYHGIYREENELHVTLHPRYLGDVTTGLCDYFNKQINCWHPKLEGFLANYGKLKLKSNYGLISNDEAHIHIDVVSEFFVFRPKLGSVLQGIVVKTSPKHVACLLHGAFSVACYQPSDLNSNRWWGNNAQIGDSVRFKILKLDKTQKIPFILGELEGWKLDQKIPITTEVDNKAEVLDFSHHYLTSTPIKFEHEK